MTTFLKTTEAYQQGARTLPGRYYTTPEILSEEAERIFRKRWICVGRVETIAQPGDYIVVEIAGESVIVLKDQSGERRAFYNVCRHRGTRLCEATHGRLSETIQCPYHAWTYALDGRLILARDAEPLPAAFAPLVGRFARYNLPNLRTVRRIEYDVRANWKLVLQNYNECLHCPTIHPELSTKLPYTSGANDLIEGPFLGGYMEIKAPNESATLTGRACGLPLGDLPDADRRRAFYYALFPTMMLSLHPDYAVFYTVWPKAPAESRVVCEWLVHPDSPASPGYNIADAEEFWDRTNRQDWHICERSQLGVSSRMYQPGPYSPRESIPAAWDREYLRVMGHAGKER